MEYSKFIKPKEIAIGETTFAISQIPALESQEVYRVVAKSVKDEGFIGMTMLPTDIVRAMLAYTAVNVNGTWFPLDTAQRIDGYLQDKKALVTLIVAMVRENWGFLADGSLLDVLGLPGEAESE